ILVDGAVAAVVVLFRLVTHKPALEPVDRQIGEVLSNCAARAVSPQFAKGMGRNVRMNSPSKAPQYNPAVLPMEFRPRMAYVSDEHHTKHSLIPGKIFASAQPFAISTIVGSGVA